jgi:hypothetical protein
VRSSCQLSGGGRAKWCVRCNCVHVPCRSLDLVRTTAHDHATHERQHGGDAPTANSGTGRAEVRTNADTVGRIQSQYFNWLVSQWLRRKRAKPWTRVRAPGPAFCAEFVRCERPYSNICQAYGRPECERLQTPGRVQPEGLRCNCPQCGEVE